jgi:hypothetical protein
MTIKAHDIGTFLVRSRSRPGEWHVVSVLIDEYYGCTCEGFQTSAPFGTCAHIREVTWRLMRHRLSMIVAFISDANSKRNPRIQKTRGTVS